MINSSAIMAKVRKYARSPEGKKRIEDKIDEYISQGRDKTDAGSNVVNINVMARVADRMIELLKEHASAVSLPASVLDHFNSLKHDSPVKLKKNKYMVDIYFDDDLSRMSLRITSGLRMGQRTGGGIDNIIALFDTGYTASAQVIGQWDGHEEAGNVRSVVQRNGLHFLEGAVNDFNREFGDEYSVTARISDKWPEL